MIEISATTAKRIVIDLVEEIDSMKVSDNEVWYFRLIECLETISDGIDRANAEAKTHEVSETLEGSEESKPIV